jgi:hypothetical protein
VRGARGRILLRCANLCARSGHAAVWPGNWICMNLRRFATRSTGARDNWDNGAPSVLDPFRFVLFGSHRVDEPTPTADLAWEEVKRKSGRAGQVHPIGGFTGEAEYAGPLAEFLPWLGAARWVGVGRQTVWGKGDVRVL